MTSARTTTRIASLSDLQVDFVIAAVRGVLGG
jgi:hypothetical protein